MLRLSRKAANGGMILKGMNIGHAMDVVVSLKMATAPWLNIECVRGISLGTILSYRIVSYDSTS